MGALAALLALALLPAGAAGHSVVLYLAKPDSPSNLRDLQRSLTSLRSVFLEENPQYPVVVAYEEEDAGFLNDASVRGLSSALGASVVPCEAIHATGGVRMCFAGVRGFREVPWPFGLYQDDYTESDLHYSRLGYRNMCRFWVKTLFDQPFMLNVSSYLRLDTDLILQEMQGDPFATMAENELAYLGSVMYEETARTVEGLWETFLRFSSLSGIHPGGLAPLSNHHKDAHSDEDVGRMPLKKAVEVLLKRGYNLLYYYNNWEASRVDLWRTPVYAQLMDEIDRAGGIFMRRWGDAPIRTLSLFFLRDYLAESVPGLDSEVFRQMRGLRYFHKASHATPGAYQKEVYVYDRPICTGLGDRVGILATLAALARLHGVRIVFEWCQDPSQIFSRVHKHIPRWSGYNYSVEEFVGRFWPHQDDLVLITDNLTHYQRQMVGRVVWEGLAVPGEAGLDHCYTTAWKALKVPNQPEFDANTFKNFYKLAARSMFNHALRHTPSRKKYIAVHMRGGDDNTYEAFPGVHDAPEMYCTGKVLKAIMKNAPRARVFVLSNNVSWAKGLLKHKRLEFQETLGAFEDFALLLGASGIVQHAQHGWSAYSSNPAMLSGVPMITTYKPNQPLFRLDWFRDHGGVPDEFHDCNQIGAFVQKVGAVFNE